MSGDTGAYWPTATAGTAGGEGANALNQPRSRGTLKTRVSGTSDKAATVTVGGVTALRESPADRYWDAALPNYSQNASLTVSATLAGQTTQTGTVQAVTRPGHETLAYDEDGNLTADAQWTYEWDAENRLRRMKRNATGASWGAPDRELEFTYDYVGRRIRKLVKENGAIASDCKFLYDGWNLIAEIDTATGKIVRSHVWGLDVASSLTATGGVGALVLQTVHSDTALTSYHVAYDGGGHVTALVTRAPGTAADGKVAVAYEYGPYGEKVRAAVDPALSAALKQVLATQPFRFSTKFTDGETGLVYYGLRYYDPSLGRFLNRDPIGEAGGENLYAIVGNRPINDFDVYGLYSFDEFFNDSGNFVVGFGDSMSFGITRAIRDNLSFYDGTVDYGSQSYRAGEYSEVALEFAVTGGSVALTKAALKRAALEGSTKFAADRVAARATARLSTGATVNGNRAIAHHVNPLLGHPGVPGYQAGMHALFPTAGLPKAIRNAGRNVRVVNAAEHGAAHLRLLRQENFLRTLFSPTLIAARLGRNAAADSIETMKIRASSQGSSQPGSDADGDLLSEYAPGEWLSPFTANYYPSGSWDDFSYSPSGLRSLGDDVVMLPTVYVTSNGSETDPSSPVVGQKAVAPSTGVVKPTGGG